MTDRGTQAHLASTLRLAVLVGFGGAAMLADGEDAATGLALLVYGVLASQLVSRTLTTAPPSPA